MVQKPELNGWNEWSKYVLKELERLNSCYEKLDDRLNSVQRDIVGLKLKAGLWGSVGAAIPVLIGLAIMILRAGIQ